MNTSIIDRIRQISIFSDFSSDEIRLNKIANKLTIKDYNQNDTIISEGDEGDTLYILNSGSVRILRNTLQGEEFALVNLCADQNVFFGEIALIDNDKRSATVIALSKCQTLILNRSDYLQLCEEDPLIGYKITFKLALRLGSTLRKSSKDMIQMYQALIDEIS